MTNRKQTLNFLIEQMELIARTYFETKRQISEVIILEDSDLSELQHRQTAFIRKVENSYNKLNPLEQVVINNDFFYEEYPFWWKRLYSKSQYTHLKKRAMTHFLSIFYDEN